MSFHRFRRNWPNFWVLRLHYTLFCIILKNAPGYIDLSGHFIFYEISPRLFGDHFEVTVTLLNE